MIIYPAIDLRKGRVVRLVEGDPDRETIYSDDPLSTAAQWLDAGARWIHMVNLDGAFASANDNGRVLEAASKLTLNIQFGGGLRQMSDIARAFDQGAARVVLGTIAVSQPEIVEQALAHWGAERICVALDARDGKITTHGWQETTTLTPISLGQILAQKGVKHALYTDVQRDGHLTGVNVAETIALGRATGLQVIASGGLSTTGEIETLRRSQAVAGAVIGTALYQNRMTLQEALIAAEAEDVS